MGVDSSKSGPDKRKMVLDGENEYFRFGVCEMRGWRRTMEDAALAKLNFDGKNSNIFGIFDGHGGSLISKFVASNLLSVLTSMILTMSKTSNKLCATLSLNLTIFSEIKKSINLSTNRTRRKKIPRKK